MDHNLKPYPAYKDSGVPWLGEIPTHWELRRLKNAFKKIVGGSTPTSTEATYWDGDLVWVTPLDVSRTDRLGTSIRKITLAGLNSCSSELVPPGSVIVTSRAPVGNVALAFVELCTNQGCKALIPDKAILESSFGFVLLQIARAELQSLATGTTFMEISKAKLGTIVLPLPPLSEQSNITAFLDHIDCRVNRLIRVKRRMIALLNEQKQAIIHRAVTRGLDPDVRLKPSGVEWLGEVPEHWELRRAKTVCSSIIDCKNRTPEAVDSGSYLVVRTTCIRNGAFDPSGGYKTDEVNYLTWTARGAPRLGDVFFTREAPAGEACLVPDRGDICMGQRMMYFRPDPELLDPEFLLLNIYGPLTRTYVELETNGSTVGHLRLGQVFALPILWCPIEEQRSIVKYVEETTVDLDRARATAQREIDLIREYRTRLVADVVTGKLDVRGVDLAAYEDEIAEIDDGLAEDSDEGEEDLELAEEAEE